MARPIVTADLFDLHHTEVDVCELQFQSYGERSSFFGQCVTLKVFEDHQPVLEVLTEPGQGRVLVVDAGGSLRVGVMGDRVASVGAGNGWAGAVIFGAVRDSEAINALEFGVKALGATARRTFAHSGAARDMPVRFGSVTFAPGNWVYADRDAVLVSPAQLTLPDGSEQ
jgi:regulator of ribonuclease activity A